MTNAEKQQRWREKRAAHIDTARDLLGSIVRTTKEPETLRDAQGALDELAKVNL